MQQNSSIWENLSDIKNELKTLTIQIWQQKRADAKSTTSYSSDLHFLVFQDISGQTSDLYQYNWLSNILYAPNIATLGFLNLWLILSSLGQQFQYMSPNSPYETIKTSNRNFFRSICKKNYRNKIVIKNLLLLSYRRGKLMRYPESPKVTVLCVHHEKGQIKEEMARVRKRLSISCEKHT